MSETLNRFKHYKTELAFHELDVGQNLMYQVTTINGTFATIKGKQRHTHVHKNEYKMKLEQLIEFIRDTNDVAEDVVSILPLGPIIGYDE